MKCRIEWCQRERVRDALYCREHLNDAWANRLPEREPAWIARMREKGLPAKEMTRAA
jgi:hypothetical protein